MQIICAKRSPGSVQLYGRWSLWVDMWPRTCSGRENVFPQPSRGHTHCRWPVCRSRCRCSLLAVENAQLQPISGQAWGRSPMCTVRWWCLNRQIWSKRRPQPSNWHCSESLLMRCLRACDIIFHLNGNDCPQPGCEHLSYMTTTVRSNVNRHFHRSTSTAWNWTSYYDLPASYVEHSNYCFISVHTSVCVSICTETEKLLKKRCNLVRHMLWWTIDIICDIRPWSSTLRAIVFFRRNFFVSWKLLLKSWCHFTE